MAARAHGRRLRLSPTSIGFIQISLNRSWPLISGARTAITRKSIFLVASALLLAFSVQAQTFTKAGFYSVDATGWQRNTTPAGDVFTCSTCGAQVQVQIDYGSPLPDNARFKTNEQFLASLKTETQQKDFADQLLRQSIPLQSGFKISIERVGLTKIGGIDALQFMAVVELAPNVTRDTSMIALHKNRLVKITLNYYDGTMNEKTRAAVNSLFKSLKFL
jgi:hypothetical protein